MNKIELYITSLIIVLSSVAPVVIAVGPDVGSAVDARGNVGTETPNAVRSKFGMNHGPVKAPAHITKGVNHPKRIAPDHVTRGVNHPKKVSTAKKGYLAARAK